MRFAEQPPMNTFADLVEPFIGDPLSIHRRHAWSSMAHDKITRGLIPAFVGHCPVNMSQSVESQPLPPVHSKLAQQFCKFFTDGVIRRAFGPGTAVLRYEYEISVSCVSWFGPLGKGVANCIDSFAPEAPPCGEYRSLAGGSSAFECRSSRPIWATFHSHGCQVRS